MANLGKLATDDDNSEFVGAHNPDDLLHVRFYERALQNNFLTAKEGRPIFDTVIFTEIHTPGNQLNIIDRPKCGRDEQRFPRQWAYFKNTHSEDPAKQGTPLASWPFLDVAKVEMLKAMKFFTVEQIAFASDLQINTLGMLAGMGPLSFRDKAKAYLEVARDANAVSKRDEALKASDEKLAELKAKHAEEMAAMQAKVDAIMERLAAPAAPSKPAKRKYVMTDEHKAKMKAAREAKKAAQA
jgi:hypothetical protein